MIRADAEEVLSGGNMAPVVRVGDTVRRETGEWTPAVHLLLRTLADVGIDKVPHVLGLDEKGREALSFVQGEVLADAPPAVRWSEDILVAAARLLRLIHDASVPLVARDDLVWRSPSRTPAEVVCHNDFAPYNLIVRGGELAGVIDFDFAAPGSRLRDLAYLAYRIVPFAEDAADALALERDGRLARLIDAYAVPFAPTDVVAVAAERLDDLTAFTRARARETGRADLVAHAAMYERDAARLRDRA